MTDARWTLTEKAPTRARELRRNLTDAERIVWYGVRAHRLNGAGFRRQAPIGPYIVDFVSRAAKLIVEIDGGLTSRMSRRGATRGGHVISSARAIACCDSAISTS
jgi:very-short-patch-repair endonuclease